MIGMGKVFGLIIVRGGLKGVLGKNICKVGGCFLIVWIIVVVKDLCYLDGLVIFFDSEEIILVVCVWGCDVFFC